MDQPDTSESNSVHWTMFVALAVVLAAAEIRIYVLLRLWAGEITGMQIANRDIPDSGLSNPLIYIMLLSVILIAMICYRKVHWLALALVLSIPIAFIGMISV
jgi:dipeptide/tripeptide permease